MGASSARAELNRARPLDGACCAIYACGTLIDWVQTPEGKWVPLDPEPVLVIENGGTDRFITDEGQTIIGRRVRLEERSIHTPAAFVPHSCARLWRA